MPKLRFAIDFQEKDMGEDGVDAVAFLMSANVGEALRPIQKIASGGELSRLRLCMLMDESINLLILDEPTNHLDIDSREWLEQAVEEFDGTLLFVSHDINQVKQLCKRAIWIDHGHIRGDGPAEEVCNAYVEAMQRGE